MELAWFCDPFPSTLRTMARQLRLQYPGVGYYVMNRGDHCEVIFREWGRASTSILLFLTREDGRGGCHNVFVRRFKRGA